MYPTLIQLIVQGVAAGCVVVAVVITLIVWKGCKGKCNAFQEWIILLVFPPDFIALERVTDKDGSKKQSLVLLGNVVDPEYEAKTRSCCFIAAMALAVELLVIFISYCVFKQHQGCPAGVINMAEDWHCFYEGNDFDCFNYLTDNYLLLQKAFRVNKVVCTKISFSPGLAAARALGTYKLVIFVATVFGKIIQISGDPQKKNSYGYCFTFFYISFVLAYIGAFVGLGIYLARDGLTNLEMYKFIEYLVSSFMLVVLPFAMVWSTRKRYFLGESEDYPLPKTDAKTDVVSTIA